MVPPALPRSVLPVVPFLAAPATAMGSGSDQSAMKDPDDDLLPTPMVLVVVSGGVGTLDTIVQTLEQERPVVILSESGGVATLIYRYCEYQVIAISPPSPYAGLDP